MLLWLACLLLSLLLTVAADTGLLLTQPALEGCPIDAVVPIEAIVSFQGVNSRKAACWLKAALCRVSPRSSSCTACAHRMLLDRWPDSGCGLRTVSCSANPLLQLRLRCTAARAELHGDHARQASVM